MFSLVVENVITIIRDGKSTMKFNEQKKLSESEKSSTLARPTQVMLNK